MKSEQTVCILGLGFVGLTLAVVMAENGHNVIGVETNKTTYEKLTSGISHFFEIGLENRLSHVIRNKKLKIVDTIKNAKNCDHYIITVGTPLDQNGIPNLNMVKRASLDVASAMGNNASVILRSTVRLGTTRNVVLPILHKTKKKFFLSYCPERTIEGNALSELKTLPQICGGLTAEDTWKAAYLFQSITPTTIRVSSLETAELIKLLDNSYRDLFFSFGNEVALICEHANLDANEIINAGNLGYTRTNIAKPGLVGGPCLEKDPHILSHSLQDFNFTPKLINTGREINESMATNAVKKISPLFNKNKKIKIGICGMAFKGQPETDDLRGSPALALISEINRTFPNAMIYIQDFATEDKILKNFFNLPAVTISEAFDNADLVFITNNNKKYERLNTDTLIKSMHTNSVIYDFWNILPIKNDGLPRKIKYIRLGKG